MTLHNEAIQYVANTVNGRDNHNHQTFSTNRFVKNRLIGMEKDFIPDVVSESGAMYEVEVLKHKFSTKITKQYLYATKQDRHYIACYLVIPNFDGLKELFDDVHILIKTKKGLGELKWQL